MYFSTTGFTAKHLKTTREERKEIGSREKLNMRRIRLQLPHFIILAVKDPSATFLWHCKHERYFPNVSRPMTSTLASVVVKESGSSTDWGKDSMKSSASDTVQSCIVVPKASLSDLYSFITLTLWNV